MDNRRLARFSDRILPEWVRILREVAEHIDLGYEPVALRCFEPGRAFLSALRSLGGSATPLEPFHHWILDPHSSNEPVPGADFVPELIDGPVAVVDFQGVMLVELDGEKFLAMRTDRQEHPMRVEPALVLGAPTLEAALHLARKLTCARKALWAEHPRVFGTSSVLGKFPEVAEEDVILAPGLYRDMLQYLDGFRRSAPLCAELRIAPNRGVL